MMVYVERRVADDATLSKDEAFGSIRNQLCTFREGESAIMNLKVYISHCFSVSRKWFVKCKKKKKRYSF